MSGPHQNVTSDLVYVEKCWLGLLRKRVGSDWVQQTEPMSISHSAPVDEDVNARSLVWVGSTLVCSENEGLRCQESGLGRVGSSKLNPCQFLRILPTAAFLFLLQD